MWCIEFIGAQRSLIARITKVLIEQYEIRADEIGGQIRLKRQLMIQDTTKHVSKIAYMKSNVNPIQMLLQM